MDYNVDYFIKKFEAIAENFWITGKFAYSGRHCANGHCGSRLEQAVTYESAALQKVFSGLKLHYHERMFQVAGRIVIDGSFNFPSNYSLIAAAVNNGESVEYQQYTPKQRILAALYDIKKAQQPEVKERIVYVTVDAPVRELQEKELSLQ